MFVTTVAHPCTSCLFLFCCCSDKRPWQTQLNGRVRLEIKVRRIEVHLHMAGGRRQGSGAAGRAHPHLHAGSREHAGNHCGVNPTPVTTLV